MFNPLPLYRHMIEDFGWSIIRLSYRSKIPIKDESPKTLATTRNTLEDIERHPHNIGIMGGRISNIVIVDLDSPSTVQWAEWALTPTPLKQRTHKGEHWIYRLPEGLEVRPRVAVTVPVEDGLQIDLRGEESYVVGPYSIHPNGTLYEPMRDWTEIEITEVPLLPKVMYPPPPTEIVRPAPTPVNLNRQPQESEYERLEARVRRCLEHCDPSVSGQWGQDTLFRAVCWVLDKGWGDVGLITRCVADWDAQNSVPPWGHNYVARMVERCVATKWSGYCEPLPEQWVPEASGSRPKTLHVEQYLRGLD